MDDTTHDPAVTTVLVPSGVTHEEYFAASSVTPDHVLDSLGDVGEVLTA